MAVYTLLDRLHGPSPTGTRLVGYVGDLVVEKGAIVLFDAGAPFDGESELAAVPPGRYFVLAYVVRSFSGRDTHTQLIEIFCERPHRPPPWSENVAGLDPSPIAGELLDEDRTNAWLDARGRDAGNHDYVARPIEIADLSPTALVALGDRTISATFTACDDALVEAGGDNLANDRIQPQLEETEHQLWTPFEVDDGSTARTALVFEAPLDAKLVRAHRLEREDGTLVSIVLDFGLIDFDAAED